MMTVRKKWVCTFLVTLGMIVFSFGCGKGTGNEDNPAVRDYLKSCTITEINYNPIANGAVDGSEYEFIEIKNTGSSAIDLSDVGFTDGIEYSFPTGTKLQPDSFIVLAANSTEFTMRYGFVPFGVYSGKLSNSGEKVSLSDIIADKKFCSVEYGDNAPWPVWADGEGYSLVPVSSDYTGDITSARYWRASFKKNGSPGKDDPGIVYVNEVLTHTDLPEVEAVELYNPNNTAVDIGGWYLTDRKVDPAKFRIPAGTTVPAHGYKVFTANDFNADPLSATSFLFSEYGEDVYLSADSTGYRGGYYHGFAFGASDNGVSFGRLLTSAGEEKFVAQKSVTLGAENAGPRIGPLVITEIMYNPKNGRDEYVEIKNIGSESVSLSATDYPDHTWKISRIGFSFPQNTVVPAGGFVVVYSNAITESEFRSLYSVPSTAQLFAKTNDLSNSQDTIALQKPGKTDTVSTVVTVPYIVEDQVIYNNGGDWPNADGNGSALVKKDNALFGDDPQSWKSDAPGPGK